MIETKTNPGKLLSKIVRLLPGVGLILIIGFLQYRHYLISLK